jgi:hypothetical protein
MSYAFMRALTPKNAKRIPEKGKIQNGKRDLQRNIAENEIEKWIFPPLRFSVPLLRRAIYAMQAEAGPIN